MKHTIRRTFSLLLTLALILSTLCAVSANGSVSYRGSSEKFVFSPGSDDHPTDLFDAFKNVMPGDRLTQKITLSNDASYNVKVKLYVRALGAQSGEDFLSQLRLSVRQEGKTTLFDAAADETAALSDWVYLGLLYSGGSTELDLTLDVPLTLDNSYQNAVGVLDWEFMAVEYPVEPSDPQPPKTGADYMIAPAVCVLIAAALVLFLVTKRKKEEQREN